MLKRLSCLLIAGIVLWTADGYSGMDPKVQMAALQRIKEAKAAVLKEYNQQKKYLRQSLQEQFKKFDNTPEGRRAKAELMQGVSQQEKELLAAFQQKMRELNDSQNAILGKSGSYVNKLQNAAIEQQRIVDLQQRIAAQDAERKKTADEGEVSASEDAPPPPSAPVVPVPPRKSSSTTKTATDEIREGMGQSISQVKKKLTDQLKESQERRKTFKDRPHVY